MFWPAMPQARARAALRQSVLVVRQNIGADAIIASGDEALVLSLGALRCDEVGPRSGSTSTSCCSNAARRRAASVGTSRAPERSPVPRPRRARRDSACPSGRQAYQPSYRIPAGRSSSNSSTRTNRRTPPRRKASVRGAVSCTGPETTVPSGRHPPSVTRRCRYGCPFAADRCHGAGSLGSGGEIEPGVDARARRLDPGCRTRPRKRFEGSREVEQFHVIETEDGEVLQAT